MDDVQRRKFVTADWHLGEDRFEIMNRPFTNAQEHVDKLVENHNKLVKPEDIVYMLGDVCYQKTPEFLPQVARLNGKKILVRGNHDRVFSDEQLKEYFISVTAEGEGLWHTVGDIECYLTHYPSQAKDNYFNLVGHIHGAWKFQLNTVNVGVDCNHFFPYDLDKFVPFASEAVRKYYDDDVWAAYLPQNMNFRGLRGKPGTYFTKTPT